MRFDKLLANVTRHDIPGEIMYVLWSAPADSQDIPEEECCIAFTLHVRIK